MKDEKDMFKSLANAVDGLTQELAAAREERKRELATKQDIKDSERRILEAIQQTAGLETEVRRLVNRARALQKALSKFPVNVTGDNKTERKDTMPNPAVTEVIEDIRESKEVIDGAIVFVNGVPGLISAAVAKAIENGATAEELKPVSDVANELQANAKALKDALLANTPQP